MKNGPIGPIGRGGLLVSSSTPGHAIMPAPANLQIGMCLGKTLFDGKGTGMINVLVTLR